MNFFKKTIKAFSLTEAILAVSVFALMVAALMGAFFYGNENSALSGDRQRATMLAEEGLEAARSIRDDDFASLTDGTHGIATSSNQWILSGTEDQVASYTRKLIISTVDQYRKKAVAQVTWNLPNGRSGEVSLSTYLTKWQRLSGRKGMLVYADNNAGDTIRYKILDESGVWGSEMTIPDFGVPLNRPGVVVKLYASPTRDEKIIVAKFSRNSTGKDQYLYAQVYNGTSGTWGGLVSLANWSGVTSPQVRDFDGAYLANGNFFLVFEDNSTTPRYTTWNGSTWTASAATLNVGGNPDWITVKNQPGTNNALIMTLDAGEDVNTFYYNGSTFSGLVEHSAVTYNSNYESADLTWNNNSTTTATLSYALNRSNNPVIKTWTSGVWSGAINNINIGGAPRQLEIVDRPGNNSFMGCFSDTSFDINCLTSNFTPSWSTITGGEVETNTYNNNTRTFDMAFEGQSGNLALVLYSGDTTRSLPKYNIYSPTTNSFSSESSLTTITGSMVSSYLVPKPQSDDIMAVFAASDQDVWTAVWDGTNNTFYSTGGLAKTEHGIYGYTANTYWYSFDWDRHY